MKVLVLSLTVSAFLSATSALKILAVFPAPSYSHFVIGDVLGKELAKRGHDVTVVGAFNQETTIENYTFIELMGAKEYMEEFQENVNVFEMQDVNAFIMATIVPQFTYDMTKLFYENEYIQKKLIRSKESYDLIIIEHFFNEGVYGLCDLLKAPCVAVCTVGAMNWINRLTGNIGMASYVPNMLTKYSPKMSIFERFHNLALMLFEEIVYHAHSLPKMEKLMHQHIPTAPSLYKLIHNVSLVLLNSHPALSSPLPLTPNMIEVGGIHVEGKKDVKLPSDLQTFLNKHSEGVVYFALGSAAKSKDMPKEILHEIIKAFKKWGKPILWKYEEDLPEKLDNVWTAKWFPQTAILAHKNVVAFITHCGRMSSLESLYSGVPMVGLPIFAEQAHNAAEMVAYGYGVALNFKTIKAEDVYNAIVEVTTNEKYSKEAKMRSKAMRKRSALKEAVYWIEHVAEFKGASYLRNAGVDLPWYQFWMVDVIGFLVIVSLGVNVVMAYLILKICSRRSKGNERSGTSSKNKKMD